MSQYNDLASHIILSLNRPSGMGVLIGVKPSVTRKVKQKEAKFWQKVAKKLAKPLFGYF